MGLLWKRLLKFVRFGKLFVYRSCWLNRINSFQEIQITRWSKILMHVYMEIILMHVYMEIILLLIVCTSSNASRKMARCVNVCIRYFTSHLLNVFCLTVPTSITGHSHCTPIFRSVYHSSMRLNLSSCRVVASQLLSQHFDSLHGLHQLFAESRKWWAAQNEDQFLFQVWTIWDLIPESLPRYSDSLSAGTHVQDTVKYYALSTCTVNVNLDLNAVFSTSFCAASIYFFVELEQFLFEAGFYWRPASIEGRLLLKAAASIEGRLLLEGGFYWAASIEGRLLLKGGFYWRAASIEGRLLLKGGFYWRAASIEGRLLLKGGHSRQYGI